MLCLGSSHSLLQLVSLLRLVWFAGLRMFWFRYAVRVALAILARFAVFAMYSPRSDPAPKMTKNTSYECECLRLIIREQCSQV